MTTGADVKGPPPPDSDDVRGILARFLSDVTVDEYARSPERERRGDLGLRRWSTWVALAVAALVGVIVVGALLSTRLSTDERQATRAVLSERVRSLSDAVASRQEDLEQRSSDVRALQDRLLAGSDAGPARAAEIATLSVEAAADALSGPGVVVTIDDAPDAAAGSLNRVLDRDLQDIVNALWREGATGIAINDERLAGTTAIRAAGEAILVNYQPLNRPYVIASVGGQHSADDGSGIHGLLAGLSANYGLVTDLRAGDVALPAGELRRPRYASTSSTSGGETIQ